ncbi:MAG: cytochrome c oxidase subunit 3 [Rubrivivax sp.]
MSATAAVPAPPRLRGDVAMWFVIGMEMLTFGLLFVTFAVARARELPLFKAGQATLALGTGAFNTALLLSGSWCVARGVHALRVARAAAGARWLWAGAGCGMAFAAVKIAEYAEQLKAGHDLSSDTFHMFYFVLTGFHALHVAVAVLLLCGVAWLARRGRWGPQDTHAPETVAAFWHMVDLLWVVLFPLVYVM